MQGLSIYVIKSNFNCYCRITIARRLSRYQAIRIWIVGIARKNKFMKDVPKKNRKVKD
jgi:hypothetical protein